MTLPQRGRFARASALGTVNCVPYFPTGRWGKQNPLETLKVFLRIQITVTLSNPLGRRHSGGGGGLRTKTLLQETSQCQKTRSKSLCLRFTHFVLTSTIAMPTLQKRKPKTERNPQITGRGGRARTRPDQPFRIPDRDWAFLSGLRNAVASAASGARRSLDYPRETGQTSRRNMLLSPLVGVEGRETEALTG